MIGLSKALDIVERDLVPDWIARQGIRRLLARRLEQEAGNSSGEDPAMKKFIESLAERPVAEHPEKANEQHYELPPEFFEKVLGEHLKYSACHWTPETLNLSEAEAEMLALTCERAELADGQAILELGCGWGSLTLWMAEHYPSSRILAMSNSAPQRDFILRRAEARGLTNLEVLTCDINEFRTDLRFDRVVSVEMFEHVRNYRNLMERISNWLRPDGKLFVHIFCHRKYTYPFEVEGADNWMGRHFFTGGIMPSADLLAECQDHLAVEKQWRVPGTHYARTARAWLEKLDQKREEIDPILAVTYGEENVTRWRVRWRLFFMACEELFGYRGGEEWQVCHYRFQKP